MNLFDRLNRNTLHLVAFGALIISAAVLFYAPALTRTYGVLDDFGLANQAQQGLAWFNLTSGFARVEVATGRLIPALLFSLVWRNVRGLNDLVVIRFFGLLVVSSGVVILAIWARQLNKQNDRIRNLILILGSALTLILPSVTATVTWAQKATQLTALPLAICSGIIATKNGPLTRLRWTLIIVLNLASAFSYQHFTTLSTLPVFIWAAFRYVSFKDVSGLLRSLSISLIALCSLGFNYLFVKIRSGDVIGEAPIGNKIFKLFTSHIPKSVHLHVEKLPLPIGLSLFAFVLISLIIILLNHGSWPYLVAVLMSAALSSAITLGGNRDSSYRLIMPTQLTLWFGLFISLALVIQNNKPPTLFMKVGLIAILVSIITFTGIDAKNTAYERISRRNSVEWGMITNEVEKLSELPTLKKIVVRTVPVKYEGNCAAFSEIGLLGWNERWILADQFALAFSNSPIRDSLSQVQLEIVSFDQDLPEGSVDDHVIDFLKLATC